MSRRLLLSRSPGETRAALVVDGRLIDYEVRRDHTPSRLGGVYLGRLRTVTGDGRIAFADIGEGEVLVDLDAKSAERAGWSLAEGGSVPVQITQDARRGRLARGSTRLGFAGPRLVFLPHGDTDGVSHRLDPAAKQAAVRQLADIDRPAGALVARVRVRGASDELLAAEVSALITVWQACADRLVAAKAPGLAMPPPAPGIGLLRDAIDPVTDVIECDDRTVAEPLAAYCRSYFPDCLPPRLIGIGEMAAPFEDLEEEVETALARRVPLIAGGSVAIERTTGMTAVDIDTGAAFDGASGARVVQGLNRRAAAEIARQLRLRALGGLAVVDLIGSPRGKASASVLAAFREAFRDDPARVEVDLVESRGVVLISRQWSRRPLDEILAQTPDPEDGSAPESLNTVVLRAARAARVAVARAPATRLVIHLSGSAAAHWASRHLAPAIEDLRVAVGIALSVEAHDDWPAARVEIQTD